MHELELFVRAAMASHGSYATASFPRRPHDVLPRGRGQHAGDAGPVGALTLKLNLRDSFNTGQVREQDSNKDQDRSELEDAFSVPARRLLHAEGAGRVGHA